MRYLYIIFSIFILSSCNQKSKQLEAKAGWLNLTCTDLNKTNVKLNGEWKFYWNQDLTSQTETTTTFQIIRTPQIWNNFEVNGKKLSGFGCATYQLKIILSHDHPKELALKINEFATAAKIWVNGQKIVEIGTASTNPKLGKPLYSPSLVRLQTNLGDTLDIRVFISNYHHRKGGFWDTIEIGQTDHLSAYSVYDSLVKAFLLGCIFIMALYHLGLYAIRRIDPSPLYFSIFYFALFLRLCFTGDLILPKAFNLPWTLVVRVEYISFYLAVPLYFLFLQSLFRRYYSNLMLWVSFSISFSFSLVTLVTDCYIFSHLMPFFEIYTLLLGLSSIVSLVYANRKHLTGSGAMISGFLIFFVCFINDLLNEENIISTGKLLHIGIVIFIFFQAYLLSKRFSKAFKEAERYSTRLNYHNRNLERIVKERTSEMEQQKIALELQSNFIQEAHDAILAKNQEIIAQRDDLKTKSDDITSSLVYAKRIQTAVLPNEADLKLLLEDHFVLYKPKDIVSGDFYWVANKGSKVYIAVGDCTGHGVPGAFMSMLGIAFLNEIINKKGIEASNQLLEELRTLLKKVLGQTGLSDEQKDGMDIGLAILDTETNQLQYSGAYHSLYLFRNSDRHLPNSEIVPTIIKGNRQPVGVFPREMPFTKSEIQLYEGDVFYLFTDGYESQFGGQNGEIFKIRRLKELLKNIFIFSMETQYIELDSVFEQWRSSNEQVDDILIIGLRVKAPHTIYFEERMPQLNQLSSEYF